MEFIKKVKRQWVLPRTKLTAATYAEVQEKARLSAEDAIRALVAIVNSNEANDSAKISAATILLERGYGRPTQTNINASVDNNGKPSEADGKELDERVRATLSRIERIKGAPKRTREKIVSEERPSDLRKFN